MTIHILTLFPDIFTPIFASSILKRAQEKQLVEINIYNIRDFAKDAHKTVDDKPYGGGVGMILKVDVLHDALTSVVAKTKDRKTTRIVLLDPKGETFTQVKAKALAHTCNDLILICGHYEGFDARIESYIDESISIGNFVLTGGEIPAMAIVDAITRLLPGVITDGATASETFENDLLEYPQYTRPAEFKGEKVPEILLGGNHKEIEAWRKSKQKKIVPKH
jgi:tRNA (guanine37-N1)-methyltransferase